MSETEADNTASASSEPTPGTSAQETTPPSRSSDRVVGVVGLVLAVWYTVEARTFDGTAFSSGPVGPKTLPTGIGLLFGLVSMYLFVRPDESPRWPTRGATWRIALVLGASYLYGQLLQPVGFIVASALISIVMGSLFRAPPARLVPLSIAFPIALAYVFNNLLELRLPAGWWGGF
ncbi:MAG: tripartite tricarboxylate transporter TctB family protein [Actinomycetota bacterium]